MDIMDTLVPETALPCGHIVSFFQLEAKTKVGLHDTYISKSSYL